MFGSFTSSLDTGRGDSSNARWCGDWLPSSGACPRLQSAGGAHLRVRPSLRTLPLTGDPLYPSPLAGEGEGGGCHVIATLPLALRAPRRNLDSDQKTEAGGSGGEREARLISRNHLGKLMKSQVRAEAVQHAVEAQWPIRTHGS